MPLAITPCPDLEEPCRPTSLSGQIVSPPLGLDAKAPSRMALCLGGRTALRAARAFEAAAWTPQGAATYQLPSRLPPPKELEGMLACLERRGCPLDLPRPVHAVLGAASTRRPTELAHPHACTVPIAGRPFLPMGKGLFLCAPPLAFVQLAAEARDLVELCEWAFELCGSYQTQLTAAMNAYQVLPLAKVAALRRFAERNTSLAGARKAASALRFVADGAASSREAKLALLLGLPHRYGGYGLGVPWMDYEVKADDAARAIAARRAFRCDLCWPEAKLDVEYQSREAHEGERSRLRDSRRANALLSMGWQVVGVTHTELDSPRAMDTIARTVRQRLGMRPRTRTKDYEGKHRGLRRQLGLPAW